MNLEPLSQIVLRAESSELLELNKWLEGLAEQQQLPTPLTFRIDLCLTELVTNVISYAYAAEQCPQDAVTVSFARQGAELLFEVIDRGSPFDPTAYVPAAPAASLEEAEIGGRGLRLVRQFAAALHYRREGRCNRLQLVFALSP